MNIFAYMHSYASNGDEKPNNINVDDSLTEIDKYNISWINRRLNTTKPNTLAAR